MWLFEVLWGRKSAEPPVDKNLKKLVTLSYEFPAFGSQILRCAQNDK